MRRRATTILATLLILWGVASALGPTTSWTFYTPYSSFSADPGPHLNAETDTQLVDRLQNGSSWAFVFIGCVLITLMQSTRRQAIWGATCYGLSAIAQFAGKALIWSGLPRRYHYYYFDAAVHLRTSLLGLTSLLLLAVGLLVSIVPQLLRRPVSEKTGLG